MHITVDITHPAHVHMFKHAIRIWKRRGDSICILARDKDMTLDLLAHENLPYKVLTKTRDGAMGLAAELIQHSYGVWQAIRTHQSDIVIAVAGPFIVYPARLSRIPSLVFYDTEHARLSNLIAYPLATRIYVPRAYQGEVKDKFERYAGYQELAYLHPNHFTPDASKLQIENLQVGEPFTFIRLVAWESHHDWGDYGITDIYEVVRTLEQYGRVIISSEKPLPDDLKQYQMKGTPNDVHHLLAHARLLFGESATMASEAAQLGIPSIFLSTSHRGYTDELENRYQLVYNFNDTQAKQYLALHKAVDILVNYSPQVYQERHRKMLAEQIDVTQFIIEQVDQFLK